MSPLAAGQPSREELRQAAEWFSVLQSGKPSAADIQDWQHWLASGTGAQAAWQRVEDLAGGLSRLSSLPARQALEHGARLGRSRRSALRALALLPLGGLTAWLLQQQSERRGWLADYRTSVGERRELQLADGGRLWLNTGSAADVDYQPGLRRIALYAGELLLSTGRDPVQPARPMVVDVAPGRLQALGTRFGVRYADSGAVHLAVFEGRVAAQPRAGSSLVVAAGQQALVWPDRVEALGSVAAQADGWTRGMLVADNMRLDEFLAELSRYRRGLLSCAPEVADLRIVGAYPLADTDQVLQALASSLNIRVRRPFPWWVSVERM